MSFASYEQKIVMIGHEPVIFLRGGHLLKKGEVEPFFVYLVLPFEHLTRLNRDMELGLLVRFSDYGRVILQGIGEPTDDQRRYMERYYGFDHTDPFADLPEDAPPACAA